MKPDSGASQRGRSVAEGRAAGSEQTCVTWSERRDCQLASEPGIAGESPEDPICRWPSGKSEPQATLPGAGPGAEGVSLAGYYSFSLFSI
jgi:hypothetical protein